MFYRNRRVLVTGGLGFIGSNLAIRLVEEGAMVTIVDPSIPGCGANLHNVKAVRNRVKLIPLDIGDAAEFQSDIRASETIFNLAGEVSHIRSMQFPERDLQINTVSQLRFLEVVKAASPGIRVVYAGTRQVYGKPDYLPVDEDHPVHPVDFNGVHKYAATIYHFMLSQRGEVDAVTLRLTNVYGPRMALGIPCQGFLGTFLRRLLLEEGLEIYGDGSQLRDPIYVDDAVNAFLAAGAARKLPSRTYNVGGPESLSLRQIAETAARAAGGAPISYCPFPETQKAVDIGSYCADSTRIGRELGWGPGVRFQDGMARTLEFYRIYLPQYLNASNPQFGRTMPEHKGLQRRPTDAAAV